MFKVKRLSLYELNSIVSEIISMSLPDSYWVEAELSEAREGYGGHCYLELIQKDERSNTPIAKAHANCWRNRWMLIKPNFERVTGQRIHAGMKVLLKVHAQFHENYGFSWIVDDIDPNYTMGDMARKRLEIVNTLKAEGVFELQKELVLPMFCQRIAVISSATAAGYGDFCNQLLHNSFGFVFYPRLFQAIMQGEQVEQSIIQALDRINATRDNWDVVVIIRGGGATSDLSGFDTYDLAANCAQFPLPIITGIGHERDDTVLDMISHTRVKTPTAAAEFLINHVRQTAQELETYEEVIYQEVPRLLQQEKQRLDSFVTRIPGQVQMRLQRENFRQEKFQNRMKTAWQSRLLQENYRLQLMPRLLSALQNRVQRETHRLELLAQRVDSASPEKLLKKGYSLTLLDGKVVTDASLLKPGDEVETRLAKGKFRSKVINK